MQPGGNSIEVAEVSKTLSGLLAHRYYAGTDRNDTVIRTLQEVANELGVSLVPEELDSSVVAALRAADANGEDIPNLSGRAVWKAILLYETPQGE